MGVELLTKGLHLSKDLVTDQGFRHFLPINTKIIAVNYASIPSTFTNNSVASNSGLFIPWVCPYTFRPSSLQFNVATSNNFIVTIFLFESSATTGRPNNQIFNNKGYQTLGSTGLLTSSLIYYKNNVTPLDSFPILYEGTKYWWLLHVSGPTSANMEGFTTTNMLPEFFNISTPANISTGFFFSSQPLDLTWEGATIPTLNRNLSNVPYIILQAGSL